MNQQQKTKNFSAASPQIFPKTGEGIIKQEKVRTNNLSMHSDYLLKIIKPAVKKIFKRVLAKLGKKQKVLSVFERRKLQKLNR